MKLESLPKIPSVKRTRKRKGKGVGSGNGKTAGRGHKGQKARAGGSVRPTFEGGQMPLSRKLPFKRGRGFTNLKFQKKFSVINISDLETIAVNHKTITAQLLIELGFIRNTDNYLKILGHGDLTHPITVNAHAFSDSAKQKIEQVGGKINVIE